MKVLAEQTEAKQVRGDRLVAKVLEATVVELSRSGLENISVESVAERAQVNKTTIYRRWPTPEKLVRAALLRVASQSSVVPDTGSLRADLSQLINSLRVVLASPPTHALIRMHLGGAIHGDLATLSLAIRQQKDEQLKTIFVRAVQRGELPPGTDIDLLYDTVVGAFFNLAVFRREPASKARMEQAVDLILGGAENTTRPAKRTASQFRKHGKR